MTSHVRQIKAHVWEWVVTNAGAFIAGGYCASKADAENDLMLWEGINS